MPTMHLGDERLDTPFVTPEPVRSNGLHDIAHRIMENPALDPLAARLRRAAEPLGSPGARSTLGGGFLGHNLHPLMTDLPVGCWTSASLLDLVGGRRSRTAARRLVGLGVLATLPTAVTGMSDYTTIDDQRARRMAAVHAAGNGVATLAYALSWRARRRDRHVRGVALSLLGGTVASGTAYLGGHLAFALGVGSDDEFCEGSRSVAHGPATSAHPTAPAGQGVGPTDAPTVSGPGQVTAASPSGFPSAAPTGHTPST